MKEVLVVPSALVTLLTVIADPVISEITPTSNDPSDKITDSLSPVAFQLANLLCYLQLQQLL